MQRVLAQIRKEIVQLKRDRIALAMALVLPVILMVLFGIAISLSVTNIPLAIQDLDRSPQSRRYVEAFQSSLTFRLLPVPPGADPEEALLSGRARGALVLPPDFSRSLLRGQPARVQILIDATDANTANVLRGSVAAISRAFASAQAPGRELHPGLVQPAVRLWYNPGREDRKYIVPGALVVCLALMPPLLASLATSREKDRGTILQVYVSGVSALEYMSGKVLAYCLVAGTVWLILLLLALFLFGLRLQGDPTPFLLGSALFLFCMISFGVMIGARVPNQAASIQAMQLGGFVLSFLLSGFLFPVENVPIGLRWISGVTPARYYIELVRDAFLRGGGWPAVWHDLLALTLLSTVFFLVGWASLRKMQVRA